MDRLIEFVGPDTFILFLVFLGTVVRAGRPERIPVLDGLIATFVPFFIVWCLLIIFEYTVGLSGLMLPAKVLGPVGGIGGYLGNYWLMGLTKNGKHIARRGAAESLRDLIKSTLTFKKPR